MKRTMKDETNTTETTTRPMMVTPYRYIKLGEIKEGVIALFQIGENGEALQTPARWDERLQAYVHNGTGETLSMYDYDHLRPQLEREGIAHEPLTR